MLKVLDLFSGIGGFSLGLEWCGGFETVAFCENDPYCQRVLAKHWPDVPIFDDVRLLDGNTFKGTVDVITGGFPCQDISVAGKQAGIEGKQSGLWSHFSRLIGEIRPAYAIVENVTMLLSGDRGQWFGKILGDLAEIGYDCEWRSMGAWELGAPHPRERIWLVAYPNSARLERGIGWATARFQSPNKFPAFHLWGDWPNKLSEPFNIGSHAGIRNYVDRLRCLGNAIVPQMATLIGEAILAACLVDGDRRDQSERQQ